jgi:hypothetical protein
MIQDQVLQITREQEIQYIDAPAYEASKLYNSYFYIGNRIQAIKEEIANLHIQETEIIAMNDNLTEDETGTDTHLYILQNRVNISDRMEKLYETLTEMTENQQNAYTAYNDYVINARQNIIRDLGDYIELHDEFREVFALFI